MRGFALPRTRSTWLCASVGMFALVLAGCGSTKPTSSPVTVKGSTLVIYASQPVGPPDAVTNDVLSAERLAMQQAGTKIGAFTIKLNPVHADEVSADGRAAVQDKTAIAYLGEIAPGTSGVSVQITNQAGILEVSPTDTSLYLTRSVPSVSDSPGHFYPASGTYHRTFARVVGTTAQEAKALVRAMQAQHLSKLYVSSDGQPYGTSIAQEVSQDARSAGLSVASAQAGADAVFYGGMPGAAATRALDGAASADPSAKLFAPSALYDDSFVAGLSAPAQSHLNVSAPGFLPARMTAGQKKFVSDFQTAYGHAPQPQAIYGYEAMSVVMAVLKGEGAGANSRALIVARVRNLENRQSPVLGTYSIDNGDPTTASFVVGRPAGGKLVPRTQP